MWWSHRIMLMSLAALTLVGASGDYQGGAVSVMDGDKHVAAELSTKTTLTLNFPTSYVPEVRVDNGMDVPGPGTSQTIRVANGRTVTLTVPDDAIIDFDNALAFDRWRIVGETDSDSRATTIDIVMTEDKTVELYGTSDFHALDVRDDHGAPSPGKPVVLPGTATIAVTLAEALLPLTHPDATGMSTRYYLLGAAIVENTVNVTFIPVPEANYTLDHWEYTNSAGVTAKSQAAPFILPIDTDYTVTPVYVIDPHVLTVNIDPAGAGEILFKPDPINGIVEPGRNVEYFNPFRKDKTVTLHAKEILDKNRHFDHWQGGSIDGVMDAKVDFELTADTEVTAVYIPSFALLVHNLGGGSVTLDQPNRVIAERIGYEFYPDPLHDPNTPNPVEVTLRPEKNDSVQLDHWIVDGTPNFNTESLTVSMGQPKVVTAVFMLLGMPNSNKLHLSVRAIEGGTVHLTHAAPHQDRDTDVVDEFEEYLSSGAQVTATATPDTGMVLDYWLKYTDVGDTVVTGTLPAITADTHLIAIFRESGTIPQKSLTLEQYGLGFVSPNSGITRYDAGTEVRFFASPEPGWTFTGWSGDLNNTSEDVTIPINDDMRVVANFEPDGTWQGDYDVPWYNFQAEGFGGTVKPNMSRYPAGTQAAITATPEDGWRFVQWVGDGIHGSENASETVPIQYNTFVQAVFAPLVPITIPPDGDIIGGTFTVSPDPVDPRGYRYGDEITLTPHPDDGWEFNYWVGDVSTGRDYDIAESAKSSGGTARQRNSAATVGEAGIATCTIRSWPWSGWPVFKPKMYTLTLIPIGGGSIHFSPPGGYYREGQQVKPVAQADYEKAFDHWELNGVDVGSNPVYEFTMPGKDTKLKAFFKPIR